MFKQNDENMLNEIINSTLGFTKIYLGKSLRKKEKYSKFKVLAFASLKVNHVLVISKITISTPN